jgi:glycosyltransferase involved in cell wall biosynthesis/GT2 family glycosyltransferase
MNYRGLKVALVVTQAPSGQGGGAERLYQGLEQGLLELGAAVEVIPVSAYEPNFEQIVENYRACSKLDLSSFDVVISTKAPTFAITHPNHVVYLVHTIRVFDDMFAANFPSQNEALLQQRAEIHRMDFDFLSKTKARFAIGHEVARRLYALRGLDAEVLHPPLSSTGFHAKQAEDFFFLPGRLHPWKRVDLVIKAILDSDLPFRLLVAGTGETSYELEELARNDNRVSFLGRISDQHLLDYYARCLAVPFVPIREDYGYITLEAFASSKPVVTCRDSGEPCYFVKHKKNGLICEPTIKGVRSSLEWLWNNKVEAEKMGVQGKKMTAAMSWKETAAQLLTAAVSVSPAIGSRRKTAVVLDMQPIDPPVGGGRLRLLGLYHSLDQRFHCNYVGSYDWPGEKRRDHFLTSTLRELTVPLSPEHHAAASNSASECNGKIVIDIAFSQQGYLSQDYVSAAREEIAKADVVVFSHPWIYPLVKEYLRADQVVIYDSHNVEGFLRAQLLDEHNPAESVLLRQVVSDELDLGRRADWILACSYEDMLRFQSLYGFSCSKMRVVPNGVMAFNRDPLSESSRLAARKRLGLKQDVQAALFIGSNYGPNIKAAQFIVDQLAAKLPEWIFVIAGGVGQEIVKKSNNIIITGPISDEERWEWLTAVNAGINPMSAGSGTNIKMFDFMAASLPTVSTKIGARGIETGASTPFILSHSNIESFAEGLRALENDSLASEMGCAARQVVEEHYSWERISQLLGVFLDARAKRVGQPKPFFSVIVPSYERHASLDALVNQLSKQVERDFELIIVDQSKKAWERASEVYPFPITYFQSPVRGAIKARNNGAFLASGNVLAFTDDDCLPDPEWLCNARFYFQDNKTVGVEGRIYSDKKDNPAWRPVSNEGFEGIGFMTANLFVRSAVFQHLGGFDLQFDHPHFREDTDFGWRMLNLGKVPYASLVSVFHPAQPRNIERESRTERCKFFRQDARLYAKHPEKFRILFESECENKRLPEFWSNFYEGFKILGIEVPEFAKKKD